MLRNKTKADWKRSERCIGISVFLWAVGVSAIVAFYPEALTGWALDLYPPVLAGVIMLSVGLLASLVQSVWGIIDRWFESGYDPELTNVPWENDSE